MDDVNEPDEEKPIFFAGDVEMLRFWADHAIPLDGTMASRARVLRLARRIEVYLERQGKRSTDHTSTED